MKACNDKPQKRHVSATVAGQYTETQRAVRPLTRLSEHPRPRIIVKCNGRGTLWQAELLNGEKGSLAALETCSRISGFPDAAERKAKLRLAYALNQVLDGRKLSQAEAAKVLGVTQPKVSALLHYKLAGFSVERLMNLLTALDQDVEIVIRRKPRSRKSARISVVAEQMAVKRKVTPRQHRSFTSARRRAVTRLRKGLDLQWTPPASRDALHDRGQGSRRRSR